MILKKVTLFNFRSYKGLHIFSPEKGTSFILGSNNDNGYSSNGGGKTSLLSSIAWALYGELATGASKDSLIYYGESEVSVEVIFEGLIVRRSKKKAKSETLEFFSEELGGWIREDLDQTQNKLNKQLGVNKELFYNAFWLDNASKTVQFLFKRPAERLQALQDLLGEGFFAMAKKEATRKRQDCERFLDNISADLERLNNHKHLTRMKIVDLEMERESQLRLVDEAAQERDQKIVKLQEDIEAKRIEHAVLETEYTNRTLSRTTNYEELVANCAILELKEKELDGQLLKLTQAYSTDVCPTCGKEADKKELKEKREKLLKESLRIKNLMNVEKKKKEEVAKETRELDKLSVSLSSLSSEIKENSIALSSLLSYKDVMATNFLNKLSSLIEEERKSLEEYSNKIKAAEKTREELKEVSPMYKFWEEGFGSKGIQNLLLDDVRGLLGQFTQNYLSQFSGEVLRVVYPKSDKGFEINVSYRDKETPVSNLSRGEIGRANMAVLLALRKMLLYMNKSKIDFIVLDDAISDLDESGTQSIVDLSEVLAKEASNVFLTLPQQVPSISPDKIVRVEKKNGESRIS